MKKLLLVAGGLAIVVVCGLLGAAALVWLDSRPRAAGPDAPRGAASQGVVVPAPKPDPIAELQAIPTLAGAIATARPKMSDSVNDVDAGTGILEIWAVKRMRWADVGVTEDETSFALVQKDSDEARGKRLCSTGKIIEIEVEKSDVGKTYVGLLMSGTGNLFRFYAVGSSGALVERSAARFCGVVTGRYDYSNSGGGVGHAVKLVGMFDLPENKPATKP